MAQQYTFYPGFDGTTGPDWALREAIRRAEGALRDPSLSYAQRQALQDVCKEYYALPRVMPAQSAALIERVQAELGVAL